VQLVPGTVSCIGVVDHNGQRSKYVGAADDVGPTVSRGPATIGHIDAHTMSYRQ